MIRENQNLKEEINILKGEKIQLEIEKEGFKKSYEEENKKF